MDTLHLASAAIAARIYGQKIDYFITLDEDIIKRQETINNLIESRVVSHLRSFKKLRIGAIRWLANSGLKNNPYNSALEILRSNEAAKMTNIKKRLHSKLFSFHPESLVKGLTIIQSGNRSVEVVGA